jgi:DsbC/DsbD-like thiol-disulfide interchange protein
MLRKTLCTLLLACSLSFAQTNVLHVTAPPPFKAKAGTTVDARIALELQTGYHVNSNTPSDSYLIPLRLSWDKGPLTSSETVFPKPQMEKTTFQENPLSVFSGKFELVNKFKVAADAKPGPMTVTGKLRYQACNNVMCLPPKNLDVALQVDIVK